MKMLFSVVSLVLCLATAALWVRGRGRLDQLNFWIERVTRMVSVWSDAGGVTFYCEPTATGGLTEAGEQWHTFWYSWESKRRTDHSSSDDFNQQRDIPGVVLIHGRGRLGFGYERQITYDGTGATDAHGKPRVDNAEYMVLVPHWFLLLVFAILPARRVWVLWRKRRRRRLGLCPSCGYDLRATPGKCPECGWTAEPPVAGKPVPHAT